VIVPVVSAYSAVPGRPDTALVEGFGVPADGLHIKRLPPLETVMSRIQDWGGVSSVKGAITEVRFCNAVWVKHQPEIFDVISSELLADLL